MALLIIWYSIKQITTAKIRKITTITCPKPNRLSRNGSSTRRETDSPRFSSICQTRFDPFVLLVVEPFCQIRFSSLCYSKRFSLSVSNHLFPLMMRTGHVNWRFTGSEFVLVSERVKCLLWIVKTNLKIPNPIKLYFRTVTTFLKLPCTVARLPAFYISAKECRRWKVNSPIRWRIQNNSTALQKRMFPESASHMKWKPKIGQRKGVRTVIIYRLRCLASKRDLWKLQVKRNSLTFP